MHSLRLRTRKSAQALQVLRKSPTKTRTSFQITTRTRTLRSTAALWTGQSNVRCFVCSLFKSPNKRNFNELQVCERETHCFVLTQNTWRGRQKPAHGTIRHCPSTPKASAFQPNAASTVNRRSLSLLSGTENESAYPP